MKLVWKRVEVKELNEGDVFYVPCEAESCNCTVKNVQVLEHRDRIQNADIREGQTIFRLEVEE